MASEVTIRSNVLDALEKHQVVNQEQEEIVKITNSAAGLLSSIPMICKTERCPYSSGCSVLSNGVAVRGERCPIEADLVKSMFISYCRQLDINPDDELVQAGLIKDLCSVEIQALRANKLMSYNDFLVEVVDAIDPVTGDVHHKKELHVAVAWSERLLNQKFRLLDTLVASPSAKYKYQGDTGIQDLQRKVGELKKQMEGSMPRDNTVEEVYEIASYTEED